MYSNVHLAAGRMNSIGSERRKRSGEMFSATFGKVVREVTCNCKCTSSWKYCVSGACLATKTDSHSLSNSFIGDLDSMNAYHAKEDTNSACAQFSAQGPEEFSEEIPDIPVKENWFLRKKKGKKKDKQKEENRKSTTSNQPQVGLEWVSNVTTQMNEIADFIGLTVPDQLLRQVEGIAALLLNLQTCSSYSHFISAIFLYIRDFFESSVISQAMGYIKELLPPEGFQPQGPKSSEPTWLQTLREVQTNWTLIKGNRAFKQISKLLGILVTLGLCNASTLTFDVAGFKLFDEDIIKKHMSAYDLADAVLGTVTYFVEGAYLCFQTGSVKPLLLNDFSVLEMENEYTNILQWWELVRNGNLERTVGMSDSEFTNRLHNLTKKFSASLQTVTGLDKKLLNDKVVKLKTIINDYTISKVSSGTRRSPFAIELFGDSSQGKTTFGDQLLDALLTSSKLPTGKEYRAALNPGDEFFSNWTSDKLVAILDDLANEKAAFVKKPPTRAIIDICNNQMYYAPKAELEAKGKCFVEPEFVLVTTNTKHLDAYVYSNCPYSVQRRMNLVMTVTCKPEFQLIIGGKPSGVDSTKVREHYTVDGVYQPPQLDDIWLITIEQAVKPKDLGDVATYAPVTWRGKRMVNVSTIEAIQCALEYSSAHRLNQFAMMDQRKHREHNMELCLHDGCCHIKGMCPDHMDAQFGIATALAIDRCLSSITSRFQSDATLLGKRVETSLTSVLYKKTSTFLDRWDWICVIPEECFENERFLECVYWWYQDQLDTYTVKFTRSARILCCVLCLLNIYLGLTSFVLLYAFGWLISKSKTKETLLRELKSRNDNLPMVVRNARDTYAKKLVYGCGALLVLYAISRAYKAFRAQKTPQSALAPESKEDVEKRDTQKDVWARVTTRPLPTSKESDSSTPERLSKAVSNNILYVTIHGEEEDYMSNAIMLTSDVVLIPNHYFKDNAQIAISCHKQESNAIGGKFKAILAKSTSVVVPGTDFAICYTGTGGSYRNITKFFPTGDISNHPFILNWRFKSGEILTAKGLAEAKETSNGTCMFKGGEYSYLEIDTFHGLCGAILVSQTKSPCITGIHLGGKAGTQSGCFGTLTQKQIGDAIQELNKLEGVLITGAGNDFSCQSYGVEMMTSAPLHPKSPLNYLPEGSQFTYYGSCIGATTSRSDVRKTPISDALAEVTGVGNVWGSPKMRPEWHAWQTCLANASHPGDPFPPDLLNVAIRDYKKPLIELASKPMWQSLPLSDKENINGRPGCKFIDALNFNTAIGFPLTGKKSKYVIEDPPDEDGSLNRRLVPEIMEEITRIENLYKKGERAHTIAKACKKDEVLPKSKEKCRIFFSNPIALTFLVRKYFLPVIRFIQMNPLLAECAVGINCHGPEWDEFVKHITKFGVRTLFGGDYGKFDQKLTSQLLHASLRILIDIAATMGYPPEALATMAALSGDIVYAIIAVNGDLIALLCGTHVSGNSLTVILNSISGCLNLRVFFFSIYASNINFRDAAKMSTYGDDNLGGVHPNFPKFNIKEFSLFLKSYGQIYTMPDKESELREYLDPGEFEFLKRGTVYHESLGVSVGALLETSIWKSLHCYLRPKGAPLTPLQASAQNMDGALREWFNHGKDVYEMRREQMKEVAQKCDIVHMVPMLNQTYEDMVIDWKHKYTDEYNGTQQLSQAEVSYAEFSPHSGVEQSLDHDEEIQIFRRSLEVDSGDLYLNTIRKLPMRCIGFDVPIVQRTIGEIDLLFERTVKGVRHFVIVEIKESITQRNKGKKQVKKYCEMMKVLQPESNILGIVVDPNGWHAVIATDPMADTWDEMCFDHFDSSLELVLMHAYMLR